ncbi:hypothetical protein Pint_00707 [Pistacia integerrima]|uniref:Uncharacterized protein n=1 Tax=Pistacia integerrima TaxID=434235 RepID=A0ACC0ZIC1_9ROSI|nr:hypothetical protein Pint_00707 [Pistacia integerrima]
MRHGRTVLSSSFKSPSVQLGNILLLASITKTLSESGTRNLDPRSIPISEPLVLQVLAKNSLDSSKKIDFFRWCCSLRPDYKQSACTYSHIFRTVCKAGFLEEVPSLLNSMKEDQVVVDSETFKLLLEAFIKSGKFDSALELLDYMEELGTSLNPKVYDSVIVALVRKNQVALALSILLKLLEANNVSIINKAIDVSLPGSFACNELLVALRKSDMRVEFKQVFDALREKKGFEFDTCGYNICIHAFGFWGDLGTSLRLFKEMKEQGLVPDLHTYNSLIQLCREGHLEEALKLVEEIEGRGFVVDLVTITSLLIGFHKHGRWDWTERLMKHIRDGNLVSHVLKWKADLEASMKSRKNRRKDYTPIFPSKGDFSEIMNLIGSTISEMDTNLNSEDGCVKDEDSSMDMDQWSLSPYMDRLADQLKSDCHSSQLFSLSRSQRVQDKGVGSFDIDMVNTFLSIFLAKGKLNLACKLFEIFSDMGVNPVTYTYNSMMSSFVKKGYFNQAWGVLNEMGENVCPTDIATYNVIIQGLGKVGRADLASAVLDKLMKQGGYLDIVMYNTLINALGKAGRIVEANKLFEQMRSSGINPDVVTFNILIEVHSKAGQLKEAYNFLKMMLDSGCSPNHVTDTTLDFLGREIEKLRYQKASIMPNKDDS